MPTQIPARTNRSTVPSAIDVLPLSLLSAGHKWHVRIDHRGLISEPLRRVHHLDDVCQGSRVQPAAMITNGTEATFPGWRR
jgi:hypothetical protein